VVCAAFAPLTVEAAFALPYNVQDFGGNLQDNFKESVAAAVSSDAVRVQPFRVEILNITAAGGARRLLSDSCVVAFSIRVPGADTAKAASIAAALTLADVNTELAAFDERLPVNERGVQAATAVVQQAQVVTPPPVTTTPGTDAASTTTTPAASTTTTPDAASTTTTPAPATTTTTPAPATTTTTPAPGP